MQCSLKSLIVVVSLVAVFCAFASAFPPVQFVGLMLAMLLTVLLPYMVSQGGMVLMGISERRDIFPFFSTISSDSDTPPLTRAWTAFLFSTILLIAIYPLAREIGTAFSLLSFGVDDLQVSLDSAFRNTARRLSLPDLWRILYVWGSIHVAKWTIFFAFLTCIFGLGFARRGELKHLFARLLYFSPWIIVLHVLMLIGVWMDDPRVTGPEGNGWHWGWCHRTYLVETIGNSCGDRRLRLFQLCTSGQIQIRHIISNLHHTIGHNGNRCSKRTWISSCLELLTEARRETLQSVRPKISLSRFLILCLLFDLGHRNSYSAKESR